MPDISLNFGRSHTTTRIDTTSPAYALGVNLLRNLNLNGRGYCAHYGIQFGEMVRSMDGACIGWGDTPEEAFEHFNQRWQGLCYAPVPEWITSWLTPEAYPQEEARIPEEQQTVAAQPAPAPEPACQEETVLAPTRHERVLLEAF